MGTDQKIYTFGSKEQVVAKCLTGEADGEDLNRIYHRFAISMANSEKVPAGVNLGWEMAVYEVAKLDGQGSFVPVMARIVFEDVMKALFEDDPEFLAALLEYRAFILAEINKS